MGTSGMGSHGYVWDGFTRVRLGWVHALWVCLGWVHTGTSGLGSHGYVWAGFTHYGYVWAGFTHYGYVWAGFIHLGDYGLRSHITVSASTWARVENLVASEHPRQVSM